MLQAIGTRLPRHEASERLEGAKKRAMYVRVKVETLPRENRIKNTGANRDTHLTTVDLIDFLPVRR